MNKKDVKIALMTMVIGVLCLNGPSARAQRVDYGNTPRYAKANSELPAPKKGEKRVVLLGNSITEGWVTKHPEFFQKYGYIGRGISGQTSYNFLLRFREDVIKLKPRLVVINVGTNDVAENSCDYSEELTFGHLQSMVELARANKIKVILTSVLPHAGFGWNKKITDAPEKIASLNARIKAYAAANKLPYVDYFSAMVDSDGKSMKPALATDNPGVHPNKAGYEVMESLLVPVIEKTL